jgi:hypothetical protein
MAEIKIAELNIDVSALIKSTSEVKKSLDDLKKEQKELQDQGQQNSEQFVKNAASLRILGSEYNSGIKAIAGYTTATADQENRTQLLSLALQGEVTSIAEARESNKLLTKLRNEANATTAEGQEEIRRLNNALDANNEFIKENADAYLQQKINIGNYSGAIKEALDNLNPLNGGLTGFIQRSQEAGGVGNLLKTSLSGVSQGILGATKASLAFIATPIGAVIAVIGLALGALYNYLKSTQSGIDAVTAVTRPLQAIFTALSTLVSALGKGLVEAFSNPKKVLADLADFVKQNLINRFTAFAEILDGIISLDFKKVTNGVLQAGTGVENLTDKLQAGAQATGKFLDDAIKKGQEIDRLTKEIERGQLAYNRQVRLTGDLIDEQLLISKDTSKTFAERGAAANEIIRLTAELGKQEEEIVKKKLQQLDLEQSLKDIKDLTIDDQQKRIDLENELDAAQDRGLNAQLEQTRVLSGLKKEQQQQAEEAEKRNAELRQKALDDALAKSQIELDLFISTQGIKAKSLEDGLKLAELTYQKQLEINKREFDASSKTEIDKLNLAKENQDAINALLQSQSDLVIQNATNELNIFIENNKSKIDANKFLTDELVNEEIKRNELIAQERRDFELLRLQEGQVNQAQYNQEINKINSENQLANDAISEQRKLAEIEKKNIDFQNQLLADNATFEERLNLDLSNLERQRSQELASAEKTGADKNLINAKYEAGKLKIIQATKDAELALTSNTLGQIRGLLKENTVVAKALGVAEATINTYLGASKALATLPPPFGAIQAGVTIAAGLGQVAKISGVQFAGGGFIEAKGASHAQGGIPIEIGGQYFGEMQGGEGLAIMNKGAFSEFRNFNNTYGDGDVSRSGFMAGGGIITQSVSSQSINMSELLDVTVAAIANMPAPIVTVEDINYGQGNYASVVNGANF